MKVSNQTQKSIAQAEAAKSQKLDAKKPTNSAKDILDTTVSSSKVDLSDRAQMMQKAKALASADTINEAKVARLQKLIDEGKYKVDADKVADRLVDEHLSMPE